MFRLGSNAIKALGEPTLLNLAWSGFFGPVAQHGSGRQPPKLKWFASETVGSNPTGPAIPQVVFGVRRVRISFHSSRRLGCYRFRGILGVWQCYYLRGKTVSVQRPNVRLTGRTNRIPGNRRIIRKSPSNKSELLRTARIVGFLTFFPTYPS